MTQQMRDLQLAQARKPPGPSSPNAAKRLYRNLSGKFRVNYTSFDEGSLVGRGEKEKLRKSYLVSAPHMGTEGPGGLRVSVWVVLEPGKEHRSVFSEAVASSVGAGLFGIIQLCL